MARVISSHTAGTSAEAAAVVDRRAVEQLRSHVQSRRASEAARPTVEQVRLICEDISNLVPLGDTASSLVLPDGTDPVQFVLDVVATFGTWLAHSTGSSGLDVEFAADQEQLCLIQPANAGGHSVTAPLGYEPTASHRRDVSKALGAVARLGGDVEVISRFVSRTYAVRPARLTYPLVAGVWGLAVRNRLPEARNVSEDLVFQGLVVDAYDMLDVARADGTRALRALAQTSATSVADVERYARTALWVDEPFLAGMLNACAIASDSAVARARLARDLEQLRLRLEVAPDALVPPSVRSLSLGQVQRICAGAGIKVHSVNSGEEGDIRATLKEMGLNSDADRLVPIALSAAEAGQLDTFWDIMQNRIDGLSEWTEQLSELAHS